MRKTVALLLAIASICGAPHVDAQLAPSERSGQVAGQAKPQSEQRQGSAGDNEREASQAPFRVSIVEDDEQAATRRAREQAAQQNQDDERSAQRQANQAAMAQAIFGFLAMILLFITLLYTARAANSAKRSADQAVSALDHTVTAADAASRSAFAAEAALALSANQFSASNRPWVVVNPIPGFSANTVFSPISDLRQDFFLVLANTTNIGKTPASNARLKQFTTRDYGDGKAITVNQAEGVINKATIAPGSFLKTSPWFLTAKEVDDIASKIMVFTQTIEVSYDIPGSDQKGFTKITTQLDLGTGFDEIKRGNHSGIMFIPVDSEMT